MDKIKAFVDKDPWTGKEILRFPTFGRFNLHPYYSRTVFNPHGRYIATSTPKEQEQTLKRGMTVLGSVQVLTFPEGTVHLTIDNVPVPMHGGAFEFSRKKEILVLQLDDNKLGLVHLDSKKVYPVDIKGELKAFGEDERSFIAVTKYSEGQWMYRLDEQGTIIEQSPMVLYEDMHKISPFSHEKDEEFTEVFGNQKISDSGHFFMFKCKLWDQKKAMYAKQLIVVDLRSREISIPYSADKMKYSHVEAAFHHTVWVYNEDIILLHAMQEGKKRLTFRLLDVTTGEDHSLYPVFGAKGHHSVMDQKQNIIVTDSYSGDLNGVVSMIDLSKGTIHFASGILMKPPTSKVIHPCHLTENGFCMTVM